MSFIDFAEVKARCSIERAAYLENGPRIFLCLGSVAH
jgi:hypothetical protein